MVIIVIISAYLYKVTLFETPVGALLSVIVDLYRLVLFTVVSAICLRYKVFFQCAPRCSYRAVKFRIQELHDAAAHCHLELIYCPALPHCFRHSEAVDLDQLPRLAHYLSHCLSELCHILILLWGGGCPPRCLVMPLYY